MPHTTHTFKVCRLLAAHNLLLPMRCANAPLPPSRPSPVLSPAPLSTIDTNVTRRFGVSDRIPYLRETAMAVGADGNRVYISGGQDAASRVRERQRGRAGSGKEAPGGVGRGGREDRCGEGWGGGQCAPVYCGVYGGGGRRGGCSCADCVAAALSLCPCDHRTSPPPRPPPPPLLGLLQAADCGFARGRRHW